MNELLNVKAEECSAEQLSVILLLESHFKVCKTRMSVSLTALSSTWPRSSRTTAGTRAPSSRRTSPHLRKCLPPRHTQFQRCGPVLSFPEPVCVQLHSVWPSVIERLVSGKETQQHTNFVGRFWRDVVEGASLLKNVSNRAFAQNTCLRPRPAMRASTSASCCSRRCSPSSMPTPYAPFFTVPTRASL